jgi:hypothetical protein
MGRWNMARSVLEARSPAAKLSWKECIPAEPSPQQWLVRHFMAGVCGPRQL